MNFNLVKFLNEYSIKQLNQKSFMQDQFIAYINGEYVSQNQAKVSILDLGLTRGYGIFDFFRTYHGNPFHYPDHYNRLINSAKMLNLQLPISAEDLKKVIFSLMKKNKQKDAAVKIILTGGIAVHSFELNPTPTLIVMTIPLPLYPPGCFTDGIKLICKKNDPFLPECKTLNYIPALIAMQEAKSKNAMEVLFIDVENTILECGTSNIFAFKNNKLITPSKNIIFGITRKVILELAKDHFEVEERIIKQDELETFDEVFISASNKEIMPVRQIDDLIINNGKIGPNTQQIMHLFKNYTNNLLWLKDNVGTLHS